MQCLAMTAKIYSSQEVVELRTALGGAFSRCNYGSQRAHLRWGVKMSRGGVVHSFTGFGSLPSSHSHRMILTLHSAYRAITQLDDHPWQQLITIHLLEFRGVDFLLLFLCGPAGWSSFVARRPYVRSFKIERIGE